MPAVSAPPAAIALLSKMTKGAKDVSLPPTNGYSWPSLHSIGWEIYSYHQDLFDANASRYSLALQVALKQLKDDMNSSTSSASARVTQYIRNRADMEYLRRTVDDAFTDFDLVVMPTQRLLPQKLSFVIDQEENTKPHSPGLMDLDNCTPFNIFGLPAISIPCGLSKSGLPVGLMIAGPHFSEGKIFALAQAYERETKWDLRRPPLTPDTPVPPIRPA